MAEAALLSVRDVRVRVLEGGEGEPLLFLHGAGRSGVWLPVHEELARSHRVIAPEHPGFGQSDRPAWLDDIADMVFHYRDLLDTLRLERATLLGTSFGGWIAAEFATTYPERVSKLVLSAPAGLRVTGAPIADLFLIPPDELPSYLFADPAKVAAARAQELSPEIEAELYRSRITLAHVAWNPLLCNPRLRRRLYRITCPTLVLWGAGDRLIPPAHGEAWASEVATARLTVVENCGHAIHLDQPAVFVDEVTRFLKA